MPKKYSSEMRERALRMLAEGLPDHPNQMAAIRPVADLLGVNSETLRVWLRCSEVEAGQRPGVTTDAAEEIKRLKRENAELRRANEILKSASVFFAKELDRPTTK
ncbi:transposase [Amycolatopsis sp. K13G38]|uniref:Transposase n=1 Tax=Amycolatopsis acididurans TaxID=2724524 RepID=A0ABX1J3N1_9PSEU|nr:transposase [Amycolatopsis acididurans]